MSPESRSQMEQVMPGVRRARSGRRCLGRLARAGGRLLTLAALVLVAGLSSAASAGPLTVVGSLRVSERGEATVIELDASQKPMFSVFKLERPARLTVDLANAGFQRVPAILDVESWAVSQVATTQFRTTATAIARVMVNFRRPSHYALRTEGNRLIVTITAHQPRPKNDPAAIKLELDGAREAVLKARKDAEAERRSASSALDAAGKAKREAAQAREQAAEAKRLAEESKLRTQKGQAELERARALAARLKLDAEASRALAQQRLDAVKAARTAAERERQQAEASRLLAEQQRKQSAAALAQLEQKRREAEAARLVAEKERREAAAAKAQAQAARTEAERLKAEAEISRGEARKQRQAAETQAAALKRTLAELQAHTRDLKAAQLDAQRQKQALAQVAKLSRDRDAQVARLRGEIEKARQLAEREVAGKQADAVAVGRRVRDLEGRLNRALGLAQKAEKARAASQRELSQAQERREAAEAARQVALSRLQQEESRRKLAEKAKLEAEARAQLLDQAQTEVKARKAKLDEMTGKLSALQRALSAAETRERSVRTQVATATEEAERSRQAVRQAELATARLAAEVKQARARETTLVGETGKLRRDLEAQRRRADQAGSLVAQLQKSATATRARLARQTDAAARARVQQELARAEKELQAAERSRQQAETARRELAASISRSDRQQKSAAASLRQAEQRLADARARAESTEQKLGLAERKLRESQKQLADSSKRRQAEELRRQSAEAARRGEEQLLSKAEQKRRGAERERDDAERKLKDVRGALEKARSARLSEERALAELKQAQLKASQDLAQARKARRLSGESEARQLAAKEKGPRAEKAPLASIRDIRFVDRSETARIEIQIDGQTSHSLRRENGNPVLSFEGARLPRLLQRTLDASEFRGPIEQITSQATEGGAAQVKVTLRDPSTPATLRQEGKKLVWEFAKPKAQKAPFAAGPGRAGQDEAVAYNPTQVAPARTRRRPAQNVRRYSGRRIDLDFKDADIHNILRLLTDVGNVNIITSDNVQGRVTIRMKNVPWDQALDVILRAKNFGQVREGNLIRVAPAADLEKEREAEIARMKQVQLLRPLETRLIPLSYAQASGILDKLKYTMSPRGALTFDGRTNMVIARDIAGNLDLMERLIRNLDTQTPQVLIEARIIEARTNYSKEIGIQWGGSFVASQATGNSTGLVFPNTLGIGGGATDGNAPLAGLNPTPANPAFVVNMPASTGTGRGGAIGLTLGSVSGNININLRLSAAEANGDIRIVSAPKITTMDNVEARIEQGVTIPFSQVSAAGVQTTFQDAKLSLTVRPHVTADGSVMMRVQVTRNEPDFANTGPRGEPTILRKEAKTEMLVKDGDTSVIGGIYTTRTGRNHQRVPWFADIPILGWFFRQSRETADREEVLVFITPRIINRAQSIGR